AAGRGARDRLVAGAVGGSRAPGPPSGRYIPAVRPQHLSPKRERGNDVPRWRFGLRSVVSNSPNDRQLIAILGASQVMIESPLIQEMMAKRAAQTLHKSIVRFLTRRFGPVPEQVAAAIRSHHDEEELQELLEEAASCPTLEAFQTRLQG